MMQGLINAMRLHQDNGTTFSRAGTISGYDPGSHCVKVTVQPEGFDTGWISMSALGVGNGWGVLVGPQLGDEVTVTFDGGDLNLGKVTGRYFNDTNPPPAVPSGETWIIHKSGSLFKFHNDGSVEMVAAAGISLTSPSNITLEAPVIDLVGNVYVSTGATASFTTPTGDTVYVEAGITTNVY